MPCITVSKRAFLEGIRKSLTDQEAGDVLFEYGVELDEVVEGPDPQYKLDIPANRYDLLCLRGVIHGIGVYLGTVQRKNLEWARVSQRIKKEEVPQRPFISACIIRRTSLGNGTYQDLIEFQEKLHHVLGQNRELMAIGVHNSDRVCFPIRYTALPEEDVSFVPLNQTRTYSRKDLDELYRADSKLKQYLHTSRQNGTVPVLLDARGQILSVPPLINAQSTRVDESTENVLVEVTGTDETRVRAALDLILHHFSDAHSRIEAVEDSVGEPPNKSADARAQDPAFLLLQQTHVEQDLRIQLTAQKAQTYLERMLHRVEVLEEKAPWILAVHPSILRPDILHRCDVIEDLAIAHGYNNFARLTSSVYTVGSELPQQAASERLREECALAGFTEVFTMALQSKKDAEASPDTSQLLLRNPKSAECEVVRQCLFPSVLKCLSANQHHQLPLRAFEVSDVCVPANTTTGARNERKLCLAVAGTQKTLEDLQTAFDVIMKRIGACVTYEEHEVGFLVSGRSCRVLLHGQEVGVLGLVRPDILRHHRLPLVCALAEICLGLVWAIRAEYRISPQE